MFVFFCSLITGRSLISRAIKEDGLLAWADKSQEARDGTTSTSCHQTEGKIWRHSQQFTAVGELKMDAAEFPTGQPTGQEVCAHEFN